jgi:hypothetical protein
MTATGAARGSSQKPATVACSAPMARFHGRPSKPSVRLRRVALPAVADSHHGEQYRPTLTRLVANPANEPTRVVDSLDRRYYRSVRARPCSNGNLDRCAKLDGNGVHSQRKAVRTHPLPLHRPLFSRDERASSCAWLWLRLRRHLRLAGIGSRHSARKQAPLVGDRACLGQILLRQNVQARLVRCWRRNGGIKLLFLGLSALEGPPPKFLCTDAPREPLKLLD